MGAGDAGSIRIPQQGADSRPGEESGRTAEVLAAARPPSSYRDFLIECERQSQSDFDSAVTALSGGALGVSFAFVDSFLDGQTPKLLWCLAIAWTLWVSSLTLVLTSHYLSALALRRAIGQCDDGTIYSGRPGGRLDWAVELLNPSAGIAFVLGVLFAGAFVLTNLR